jgi:small conductance mechanosensitive channel
MKIELLKLWEFHSAVIVGLVKNLIVSIIIIAAGMSLSKAVRRLITKAGSSGLHVDETVTSLLRHVTRYGIIIVCAVMILNVFGMNTASLIAVLGTAGVAIGLALKDTLGNIAAGIILLFLGTYRRGEYIEFGSCGGTVKDINLFTTILETFDGVYISAPNSSIWGVPLKNYSRSDRRRMELSMSIASSDSVDTAFQVMRDIIAAETGFLKEPAPQVVLQAVKDNSVVITIRAWVSAQAYRDIYREQTLNFKAKIEAAGLHISRADAHIVPPKP